MQCQWDTVQLEKSQVNIQYRESEGLKIVFYCRKLFFRYFNQPVSNPLSVDFFNFNRWSLIIYPDSMIEKFGSMGVIAWWKWKSRWQPLERGNRPIDSIDFAKSGKLANDARDKIMGKLVWVRIKPERLHKVTSLNPFFRRNNRIWHCVPWWGSFV